MKSHSTTTREIFTPTYDRFTGGVFNQNHNDMMVIFNRHSDELTVSIFWGKNSAGNFTQREITDYNISSFVNSMKSEFEEMGGLLFCEDDIPEGVSYPVALN